MVFFIGLVCMWFSVLLDLKWTLVISTSALPHIFRPGDCPLSAAHLVSTDTVVFSIADPDNYSSSTNGKYMWPL